MPDSFQKPYLDSSVYIAAIKGEAAEPGKGNVSAQVLALGQAGNFPVFASTFVYCEVIKDRNKSRLTPTEESVIDSYLDHSFITWIEVDLLIGKHARALSRQHGLKPADAVHLASAIRAGCDQLLAWDSDFANGVVIEGVEMQEPHLMGLPQTLPGFPVR
jgi:predicted nucleic acid-binding protein